jgi:hypothetical protein
MIRSFPGKLVETVADGSVKKGFPPELVRRAQQLLTVLHAAVTVEDLARHRETGWKSFRAIGTGNIRSASTGSGGSVFAGHRPGPKMLKLSIIIEDRNG